MRVLYSIREQWLRDRARRTTLVPETWSQVNMISEQIRTWSGARLWSCGLTSSLSAALSEARRGQTRRDETRLDESERISPSGHPISLTRSLRLLLIRTRCPPALSRAARHITSRHVTLLHHLIHSQQHGSQQHRSVDSLDLNLYEYFTSLSPRSRAHFASRVESCLVCVAI